MLNDGWRQAEGKILQRTRTTPTGTYTERMTIQMMPMGAFDEMAMRDLLQLKEEFGAFLDWDASSAYTHSGLLEHRSLCAAANEEQMMAMQKERTQEFDSDSSTDLNTYLACLFFSKRKECICVR